MVENKAKKSQRVVDDAKRRKMAYQLYQNRQILGKSGDGQRDWETAKQILQNPIRWSLFKLHRYFIGAEKRIWEPALHWSNNQAWLSLLGNLGLIIAAFSYVASEPLRRVVTLKSLMLGKRSHRLMASLEVEDVSRHWSF